MVQLRIPKQSDIDIVQALCQVVNDNALSAELNISFHVPVSGHELSFQIADVDRITSELSYLFEERSGIIRNLYLRTSRNNVNILNIKRNDSDILDDVDLFADGNWVNAFREDIRPIHYAKLFAAAKRHLKVADAEASLSGNSDTQWSRYRDAMQAVLNGLTTTQARVVDEFTRKSLERESEIQRKLESETVRLQNAFDEKNALLESENKSREAALAMREAALKEREASFETKEARYVARQKQEKQLEEIKGWLDDWSLTPGTRSKRVWVLGGYVAGCLFSAFFAWTYNSQNAEILQAAGYDLSKITWWQWILLSIRAVIPIAAFATFLVYLIRWASAWARQHADEEFRNRQRVLDLGRTSWLLEVVRDAQDHAKELPPDLLKDLSRNLFTQQATNDPDLHPQAISDVLMQGLTSLRVKAADGTEVEASRRKS